MPPKSSPAPEYGHRLLPPILDSLAITSPNRTYASIPLSSFIAKGFCDITVSEMAHGMNAMAHWLITHIGKPKSKFPTIAYLGITDLRYTLVLLAAIKCGYKVLLPSVRNSVAMNTSLVEQTDCKIFLCSEEYTEKMEKLAGEMERMQIQTLCIPKFEELVKQKAEVFEYKKSFEEACWDPIVVLHSSGSTGLPKCVTLNNGCLARVDSDRMVPDVPGREKFNFGNFNAEGETARHYLAFPPFHLSGLAFLSVVPIYYNSAMVLGPPDRPPSAQVMHEILPALNLAGAIVPPSILEQFANEPGSSELARRLNYVAFAGGPLAKFAGNLLSTVTNVRQFYGATECLFTQLLVVDREDWEYMEFHPLFAAEFEEDVDGSYELVIHANKGAPETRMLQYTFPGITSWRTKDLFKPHPTKPHLWKFFSRKDDIIVLSNGEKMNPVPMENTIEGHPFVNGCIILGQGRFQCALLIEPTIPTNDAESVVEKIWPTVQEANSMAPAFARILRSMIVVAPPGKPFPRTGKGTVLRRKTVELLAEEIEGVYSGGQPATPSQPSKETRKTEQGKQKSPAVSRASSGGELRGSDSVRKLIRSALAASFSGGNLQDTEDFYVAGLDSLSTIELVNTLRKQLQNVYKEADLSWLSTKTIYANPTIEKLATKLASSLHLQTPSSKPVPGSKVSAASTPTDTRTTKMASMVNKYTSDLQNAITPTTQITVLITGSTGGVGSHLLHTLLLDPFVGRIICLNRSPDAKSRHENSLFAGRDLSKATFLAASFGHPLLGLKSTVYWDLIDTVDTVIHNAWKVDFNHTLESFEDVHIRGVRNFIDFALKSPRRPHIFFVSSISSCTNVSTTVIPEKVPDNMDAALKMGYGESKLVAERILQGAVAKAGIRASILRLGQIAGPVDEAGLGGEWNRREWFPALVKTSKTLGCIPSDMVGPDWVPVDRLAGIVVDIIHNDANVSQVYNLVNPKHGAWEELVKAMKRAFGQEVREVTLKEWVDLLERGGHEREDYEKKPALKIVGFFKGLVEGGSPGLGKAGKFETVHAEAGSRSMAHIEAVNGEWMERWLKQWNF